MKDILKLFLLFAVGFCGILWAQNDTTKTEVLDEPVVKTTTIIKKEIVIPKDPILAGLLSAQFPGTGQIYCGKWLKGGIFLISVAILYGTANEYAQDAEDAILPEDKEKFNNMSTAFLVGGLIVHAWNIFDAFKTAEIHNRRMVQLKTGLRKWDIGIAYRNNKARIYLTRDL
jgi:hypothetical protein